MRPGAPPRGGGDSVRAPRRHRTGCREHESVISSRAARLTIAVLLLGLFAAVYAASNLLPAGQAWEDRLLRGHDAFHIFGALLGRQIPFPPFDADVPTLVIGTLLAVALAAAQRHWRTLAVVLVAPPAALVATQLFKDRFGRPDLIGAVLDTDASYPSGHAAIAFAVTAALLLAVPAAWLRLVAPVVLGWSVLAGAALQSVGYHRPSDVLGTGLLVPAVFLLVGTILPPRRSPAPAALPQRGAGRALAVVALVAVALLGAWTDVPGAVVLYAAVALVSVALVGGTALALRPAAAPTQRRRPGRAVVEPASDLLISR